MMKRMGVLGAAALLATGAAGTAAAADGDRLVTAGELNAMIAALPAGRTSRDIWTGTNYQLMTAVRSVPGTPELHARMADLFVVQAGAADVLIGGALTGDATTAPGERRGGTISGGHVRHVAAGDVLWIPAGAPHRVTPDVGTPFRYLVVKIAVGGVAP